MNTSKEFLAECLKECGIKPDKREEILSCEEKGCRNYQLCLLGKQRAILLKYLHQAQRRIDLIDLLIDSLKKSEEKYKER